MADKPLFSSSGWSSRSSESVLKLKKEVFLMIKKDDISSNSPRRKSPRTEHSRCYFNFIGQKNIHSSSTSLVVLQMKLTVCKICHKALTVSHQGYRNVQQHINGQMHLLKSKDVDYNTKLSQSLVLKRIA